MECDSLQSVKIPERVTTIEAKAFEGCLRLTSVNLPSKLEVINKESYNGVGSCDHFSDIMGSVLCYADLQSKEPTP